MENQDKNVSEAGAKPNEHSLEYRLTVAEVTAEICKEEMNRQRAYIQKLEKQVMYLTSGGADYEKKTWIEKVIHCIEDAGGEPMSAAQILLHLEQRDKESKLAEMSDARKTISVVLYRGVKAQRLYTNQVIGVSRKVYGAN